MAEYGAILVLKWVKSYRVNGHSIFDHKSTNNKYSKEFKEMVVQEYLQGHGSSMDLAAKYGIPKCSTVLNWVNKYNSHRELKDYNPKPGVYMADTLKVSKEKKIEIIKYCIDHNHDYKGTAEFYGGNYAQIYNWVKKYESKGEDALEDRRGKRKAEEQLTDLEKAKRRIAELEKKLLETTKYVEFEIDYTVDNSLIGGMVIRIGDRIVDNSIKTRLYELTKELSKIQLS